MKALFDRLFDFILAFTKVHFSQTKDLITEIELLEEEVANREQHVLSLYRSIFEQCVSKPSSQQNSVTASPAHGKHESRKHPSVISSAFCSSKKFPLGPLQPFSVNDLGKRTSNAGPNSLFGGKSNINTGKTSSGTSKVCLMYTLLGLPCLVKN